MSDDGVTLEESARLLQKMAARTFDRHQRKFERGDKGALLAVLFECANAGLPMPPWAAKAFRSAFLATKVEYRHASWDEVFGRPHKDNLKLPAKRQEMALQWRVWNRITDRRKEKPRTDHFRAVAGEFNISVAKCRDYFYEADKFTKSTDPWMAKFAKTMSDDARRSV
jgi:hypothetical protein